MRWSDTRSICRRECNGRGYRQAPTGADTICGASQGGERSPRCRRCVYAEREKGKLNPDLFDKAPMGRTRKLLISRLSKKRKTRLHTYTRVQGRLPILRIIRMDAGAGFLEDNRIVGVKEVNPNGRWTRRCSGRAIGARCSAKIPIRNQASRARPTRQKSRQNRP